MAGRKRKEIRARDLRGLKYFRALGRLVEHLHEVGCARDRAGNRRLHMDQYVLLLLLEMFNPVCDSLRSLQRAGRLAKVQRKLGVPRASLGSLSEAARIFDSEWLVEVIHALGRELEPIESGRFREDVGQVVTLVDSTLLTALPKTASALWFDPQHKGVKAHVHYELLKGSPTRCRLTDSKGCEKAELANALEAGRLYVLDRGYAKYGLMQSIMEAQSSFLCRIHDYARIAAVEEERPVGRAAAAAGVRRDAVVRLGSRASTATALHRPVRIVQLALTEYTTKTRRAIREGRHDGATMLLATDRMDLPAEVLATVYRYRWQIELFFRFFKHVLGCRHLISHCANGIALQVYAAIIACLLIALYTGRRPTKATLEMLSWYLSGWASEAEMRQHLDRLNNAA